jgi:hypothetical protein
MDESVPYTEIDWAVRADIDGEVLHVVSIEAHNLASRERLESTGLFLGLPRSARFRRIEGTIDDQEIPDPYITQVKGCGIRLEDPSVRPLLRTGSTVNRIELRFREINGVRRTNGRRYISFADFNPTSLRASSIRLRVAPPPYRKGLRFLASALALITRHPVYNASSTGLTLYGTDPDKEGYYTFSSPPSQGLWDHTFLFDWVDFGLLGMRFVSLLVGLVIGLAVAVAGNVIFGALFQR